MDKKAQPSRATLDFGLYEQHNQKEKFSLLLLLAQRFQWEEYREQKNSAVILRKTKVEGSSAGVGMFSTKLCGQRKWGFGGQAMEMQKWGSILVFGTSSSG